MCLLILSYFWEPFTSVSRFGSGIEAVGCELIHSYYTSRENIVRLKSDLRFESIISYNINLPESAFYFFQLSHLYIMARRIKTQKSVTSPPQPLSWKEFLKNLVLAMLLLTAVFWTSSKRFHYCKRFIDVRARQEKNHWQSCWTDGKPDRCMTTGCPSSL